MKYKREIILFIMIEILQIALFKILRIPLRDQYVILKMAVLTSVSLILSFVLSIVGDRSGDPDGVGFKQKGLSLSFFFFVLIIFAYFPIISSKYFYHDDYINYFGSFKDFFPLGVKIGRIGAALYIDLLSGITVETSLYGRGIAVIGVALIFLLFNKWMDEIGFGRRISLVLPFLCSVSLPFLNISAYLTEFTFVWAALFSVLSVVLFIKSIDYFKTKNYLDFLVYFFVSFISILLSLFTYQATSTVGLGLLVAYLLSRKNERPEILVRTAAYYLYFGLTAIVYYFLNKYIWTAYNIPAISRSELISSIPELFEKLTWFLMFVLPQTVKQLLYIFGGIFFYKHEFSLYTLEYRSLAVGLTLEALISVVLVLGCYFLFRSFANGRKTLWYNIVTLIFLILALPYSYFFLLVAKESSYLSFYVSGLVTIGIVILGICGNQILKRFTNDRKNFDRIFLFIIIPVLILVSFNNNRYLYTMWVRNNDFPYFYVKKVVENGDKASKRIHIIGSTGVVDIYWINATRIALLELGESPDSYNISYADNENLIYNIAHQRFEIISKSLSQDELETLNTYYIFNPSYGYYYLKTLDITQENLEKIRMTFEKVDLIPTEDDQALIIDMRIIR